MLLPTCLPAACGAPPGCGCATCYLPASSGGLRHSCQHTQPVVLLTYPGKKHDFTSQVHVSQFFPRPPTGLIELGLDWCYVVPLVLDSLNDLCCIEPIVVHAPLIIQYKHVLDQPLDLSRAKRAIECLRR